MDQTSGSYDQEDMKQNGDSSGGMADIHYAAGCMFQEEQPNENDEKFSNLEAREFCQSK